MYSNIEELKIRYSISKSTIYRWISEGQFPKPTKLGPKTVRWNSDDLKEWETRRSMVSKNHAGYIH